MLGEIVGWEANRFINSGISRKWTERGKQSCYLLCHTLFHMFLVEQTLRFGCTPHLSLKKCANSRKKAKFKHKITYFGGDWGYPPPSMTMTLNDTFQLLFPVEAGQDDYIKEICSPEGLIFNPARL